MPNLEEALKHYGIGLSKEALIAALTNSNPEVRGLASYKLATDKNEDAIPFILNALSIESNDTNRIHMALDLALLGDPRGVSLLKRDCSDQRMAGYLRVTAAQDMVQLGNRECLANVLTIAKNDSEEENRQLALSVLPLYFQASGKSSPKEVLDLICGRLTDSSALVRLEAAITLSDLGTSEQIPRLENAITNESDPIVRSQMEDSLRKLKSKTQK